MAVYYIYSPTLIERIVSIADQVAMVKYTVLHYMLSVHMHDTCTDKRSLRAAGTDCC